LSLARLNPFYSVRSIPTVSPHARICRREYLLSQSLLQRQVYSNTINELAKEFKLITSLNPFYSVRSIPTERLNHQWASKLRSQSLLQRQVYSNFVFGPALPENGELESQSLLQRQVYSNICAARQFHGSKP